MDLSTRYDYLGAKTFAVRKYCEKKNREIGGTHFRVKNLSLLQKIEGKTQFLFIFSYALQKSSRQRQKRENLWSPYPTFEF